MKRQHTNWFAACIWSVAVAMAGFAWAQGAERYVDPASARYPGGAATAKSKTINRNAFSQSSANMGFARELDFKIGNAIFRKLWVSSPASTKSSDGLGPLFNARSCQRCHLKDGRGAPPSGADDRRTRTMVLRLSAGLEGAPDPTYGAQLQDVAVQGHSGEGRMRVRYEEIPVTLGDGAVISLRKPTYTIADLAYGPLHPSTHISPRVAPQMIGMGLLEAIPEDDLLSRADPDDKDGDGISGRARKVWSLSQGRQMIGRFGWRASMPTVLDQTAAAFFGDIGISSSLLPKAFGDCTPRQAKCRNAPHGDGPETPEISDKLLKLTTFYASNLAVPRRRNFDAPEVQAGEVLFSSIGCDRCHTPSHRTGDSSPDSYLRNLVIWPYTDLLLHDMGRDLADDRAQKGTIGAEWRTPPLWGIGLTKTVSGHTFFLHDGRARNLMEAILWHGGEAQSARDAFAKLSADERANLIKFVESL